MRRRTARLRCARRRGVAAARGRGRRRRGGGGRRALRTLRGRRRPGAGADAARQIPHAEDAALLAQPHPDGGRQRQRARGRTSGQVELQGQAAGPHHRGDALSQARGRDRAAEHPARHPLRRRRSADRRQARRHGRAPGPRQLGRDAGQCPDLSSAHAADVPGGRSARRSGAPHRQGYVGAAGRGQERTRARPSGQAVFRPYDRAPLLCPRVGQSRRRRGDDRGQYRPFAEGQVADVRLRGRRAGQARRDSLARGAALRLRDARGVPSGNGTHASDPRPHGVEGFPALQRRPLRRRPHPQRDDLLEIPPVRRELFRAAAPAGRQPSPGARFAPVVWDSYTPRRGARSTSRANCRPISAPCSTGGRITPHTYAPTPNRQYSPRRCRYRG